MFVVLFIDPKGTNLKYKTKSEANKVATDLQEQFEENYYFAED